MDDYNPDYYSHSYSPFRFHLRRANSDTFYAKQNVYGIVSTATWLGDYMLIASIINELTRNNRSGMENDRQNLRELGRGKFFFNKMQRWMFMRDKQIGFTKSFNSGVCFDVSCFLKQPQYPYRFFIKPKEPLYGECAIYKRFGDQSFILAFGNGQTYVAAETENDALWIAGITNMELLNASPEEGAIGEMSWIQGVETCDTMIARTEAIEALEVKKYYEANFPPLNKEEEEDGFTLVTRRRQPKRACKQSNAGAKQ